ncbi:MAG: alpha/beta hydrolase [Haliea sp.]|nr:alpha/beta hydrolase [Haliea sp.]
MINRANFNAGWALVEENFSDAIYNNPHRVHVIWGSNDTIAPLRTAKLLEGQLPNVSLTIIDDAGIADESQPQVFNDLLLAALTESQRIQRSPRPSVQSTTQSLHCKGKSNQLYSGVYREVVIQHCRSVVLKNIVAERLLIKDSEVQMENIQIDSDTTRAFGRCCYQYTAFGFDWHDGVKQSFGFC